VRRGGVPGKSAIATLDVPEFAPFFGDHFPRRPVFPATLLLDCEIGLAMELARESSHFPAGATPAPSRMTHVKMRSFMPPGAALDIEAEFLPGAGDTGTIRLSTRMDDKVAATARLDVAARPLHS
jgi:3-hydroxymyristoyl/3-hydroxydecanoyl-(acyl carrier protein) dehydratase